MGYTESEGVGEAGSNLNRRSRATILDLSSTKERRTRHREVEKAGNVSKVEIEIELLPEAMGHVEVG